MLPLALALAAVPAMADSGGAAMPASPPAPASAPTTPPAAGGTDPKAISLSAPAFPSGIKNPRRAVVVLEMQVLADGRIDDVKVVQSGGEAAYDEASLASAKNWKFSPATDGDGKPVDATIRVPLTFDPGFGSADVTAQVQQILSRPCRQVTAELAAWRKQYPDGKLEDMPTFQVSTGMTYAMAFTGSAEEMLPLIKHWKATLPGVYAKIVDQCAAQPDAAYENVWAAALKDAPKAPR